MDREKEIKKILTAVRDTALILERFDVSLYPPGNSFVRQICEIERAEIEKCGLEEEEIEHWLFNRLGVGNVFEQFNRSFCKDLAQAQLQAVLKILE